MTEFVFRAGYLPGLHDSEVVWQKLSLGTTEAPLAVEVPQLTREQMTALAHRVKRASQLHLKTILVSDIVRVLDCATANLLDVTNTYRQQLERLLPLATGYDSEMVRLNLTSYLQTFRGLSLQRFLAEDFPNPKVLDEFQ
ncbi:MAG: acyl-CoA reductase, partial [Burkholderiaceae bacterium]|nr:acyl-CoA reductase [Burkholderiaceae bacterium]